MKRFPVLPVLGFAVMAFGAWPLCVLLRDGVSAWPLYLGIVLAGAGLVSRHGGVPEATPMRAMVGVGIIVLGITGVVHLLSDLGVQPASDSLLTSAGLVAAGLHALVFKRTTAGRGSMLLRTGLAAVLMLIAGAGLFLQMSGALSLVLHDALPLVYMHPLAGLAVFLLSIGMLYAVFGAPASSLLWAEREDRRIAAVSVVLLLTTVLVASLVGTAIFLRHAIHVFAHTLENTRHANSSIIEQALYSARVQALEIAGIARGIARAYPGADYLERLSSVPELSVRAIRRAAEPRHTGQDSLRVGLLEPARSELVWDGDWFLETRVPGVLANGRFEELVVETRLDKVAHLMHNVKQWGQTDALVLCARHDANLLDCFPSALHRRPFRRPVQWEGSRPAVLMAAEGHSGVSLTQDFNGRAIISAYGPVGRTGLSLSQRVEVREVLAPMRDQLLLLLVGIAATLVASATILPRMVRPLVNNIVDARTRLHALLEHIPDAVITTGADGRIIGVNPAAEVTFCARAADLVGRHMGQLVELRGGDRQVVRAGVSTAIQATGQRPNGSRFPAELRIAGFVVKEQALSVAVIRDVSEREAAMKALSDSRETFRVLVENVPDAIVRFDRQGVCIYASPSLERCLGIAPAAVMGRDEIMLCRAGLPHVLFAKLPVVFESGEEASAEFTDDSRGDMRCFHVRMVPESAEEGTIVRVLCVIRDITRIRNAESALRDLVAHHTTVIEQQRKHIAREIHDELGQVLTALKTELALTGMRMAGGDSNELRDRIAIMQDLSNRAIQTVRNVARALRPATLDLGIVNAIDWLGRDFERRTGVHCLLNLPEEELELEDALATNLFRIVQEALTNVERHADAGTVEVTLRCSDRGIHLSVLDDGVGFAAEELAPQASFGLQGIRERAAMMNGQAAVRSEEQGTSVIVFIPLDHAHKVHRDTHTHC